MFSEDVLQGQHGFGSCRELRALHHALLVEHKEVATAIKKETGLVSSTIELLIEFSQLTVI